MAYTSKIIAATMVILTSVFAPILLQSTASAAIPPAPANLRFVNANGEHKCGLYTNLSHISPTWDAAPLATSYNYMVTLPDGNESTNVGNLTSVSESFAARNVSSFSVQSVYENGMTSDWAPYCSVTYDATKPVITSNISPGMTLRGTVTITETVTEANPQAYNIRILDEAGNPVSVDGKNLGAYENPADGNSLDYKWVTTDVPDGDYKLQFSARDKAGNTETLFYDVRIDNTAPGVEIDSYPVPVSDSTPTISGSVDEGNTNVQVTIGGSTYSATPDAGRWSITTDRLADSTYTINAVATDAAGNATSPPASGSITIDTTPPSVVITSPLSGARAHGFIQISGNVTDAISYSLTIDGSVVANGVAGDVSYLWDTGGLSSGTYSIVLSAIDGASNTTHDSVFVTIDNTAPAIPLHTIPANNAIGTSATINTLSWTQSDDPSSPVSYTAQVASDAGFSNVLSSRTNLTATRLGIGALADGTYYWHVQACDNFGNCSDWSTAAVFTLDNTAPIVTVDESDTSDPTPSVMGTVNDPSAIVTIRIGGITYPATVSSIPNTNGSYSWTADVTENLRTGAHSITVFARDSLGNNSVLGGAITITATSAETGNAISRLASGVAVLGNSVQTGVVSDKAVTDTKEQAESSLNSAKLPGLDWWWLPVAVVLLGTVYYGYTYRINKG